MAKDSALRLCFPLPEAVFAVWLVYPERVRDVPAVRELAHLIADEFRRRHADAPD